MRIDKSSIRTIEYLRKRGHYVVKSARSMGLFDVVSFNKEGIKLIQAKANQGPRPAERALLAEFDNYPQSAVKEIWVWKKGAREPIITEVQ